MQEYFQRCKPGENWKNQPRGNRPPCSGSAKPLTRKINCLAAIWIQFRQPFLQSVRSIFSSEVWKMGLLSNLHIISKGAGSRVARCVEMTEPYFTGAERVRSSLPLTRIRWMGSSEAFAYLKREIDTIEFMLTPSRDSRTLKWTCSWYVCRSVMMT